MKVPIHAAALLAALLAAAPTAAQTLVLPVREVLGLRAVRARFRGHVGWFVLATERPVTSVSRGFEASAPQETDKDRDLPSLDALADVRGLPVTAMDDQGVIGVLGQDFFQGKRVEFDLERGTVTLSPSTGKAQPGDVPLEKTKDGVLGTHIKVASRDAWALVASGALEVKLSPSLAKAVPGAPVAETSMYDASVGATRVVQTRLTEALRSPLLGSLWVGFQEAGEGSLAGYSPRPDALLPLVAFGAKRVALDFGAATIHLVRRTDDERVGFFANDLVRRPLAFRDGLLYLPAVSSPFPEGKEMEIVAIGGVPAERVVRAIREGGAENRALLADLTRKGRAGQTLVVLREGERVEIAAEPRP